MDYSMTFQKRNPILFITLIVILAIVSITFRTFYFSLFIVLIWIFLEYFYRLPKFYPKEYLRKLDNKLGLYRDKSLDNNVITSPCFGTIKKIIQNKNFTRIICVLSVFDVHYQFAPMDSSIIDSQYKKGEFNIAYILEKSALNERNHTIFMNSDGIKVEVIQIAGVLTRRIETLSDKKVYNQGEPYGIIHFGSRVDTIIPNNINGKSINLLVIEGQKLYGPNSILCRF